MPYLSLFWFFLWACCGPLHAGPPLYLAVDLDGMLIDSIPTDELHLVPLEHRIWAGGKFYRVNPGTREFLAALLAFPDAHLCFFSNAGERFCAKG